MGEFWSNTMQPPEPVLSREEWEDNQTLLAMLRRGVFVAYCSGYSCGKELYYRDDYVRSALGTYCKPCWNEIQHDMHVEREWGHDGAQR